MALRSFGADPANARRALGTALAYAKGPLPRSSRSSAATSGRHIRSTPRQQITFVSSSAELRRVEGQFRPERKASTQMSESSLPRRGHGVHSRCASEQYFRRSLGSEIEAAL